MTTLTLNPGGTVITPTLVVGWQTARKTRTVVHDILATEFPVITVMTPTVRSGTMKLFFSTEAAANSALSLLSSVGKWTIAESGSVQVQMVFVVAGDLELALDEDTLKRWTIDVPYQETQ